MPMTWNAEADAKFFAAVIQVSDLKLGADKLKKIAEIMGNDCTPKALTHRLSKYKALANGGSGDGAEKKVAVTKGKGGKKSKKADTPVEGEDDEEKDVKGKGKKGGGKRKKAEEGGEEDEEGEAKGKRVKLEGEDEEEF